MLLVQTILGPSCIHGIGLFADQFIPTGAIVWSFEKDFDQQFSASLVERLSAGAREQYMNYAYISRETGYYVLCADDARFINHSYKPNIQHMAMKSGEEAVAVALRDIARGEELLCDYRAFVTPPPV